MSKDSCSVRHFCELLLEVHDELVHVELETIPFDLISPYRDELKYLLARLHTASLDPDRVALHFHLSKDSQNICDQLFEKLSSSEHLLVVHYLLNTLLSILDLSYGLKPISTNRCKEA